MLCKKCGTKNKRRAKFCKKCGQPLIMESHPTPRWTSLSAYGLLLLVIIVGVVSFIYVFPDIKKFAKFNFFENKPQTEWVFWDVQDGQIDQKTEQLIKESVLENEYLNPTSKKEKEEYIWSYSIVFLQVEGNWAILSAAPVSKSNGKLVNTEGIPLLGRNINGHWEVVHPQGDKFLLWVSLIPDSLLSMETKANLVLRYGGENE